MSDYTTKAILTASVGQFTAAFKEAGNTYKRFNRDMKNSTMASTDAVSNSSRVVSTAMKAGAVAVVGLGAASLKTGADFEHQMSRVGAIAGASGSDLKALNDQAIKLGADTAFSAKEAAGGMENLASAGMNSKEIMAAMPGVLDLAAVSGGDVAQSAEDAATALNGFGLEASDSAHVADVFARAAADTNAEAADMGEAMKMVAPQAHAAGLSLEETAAAVGVMSDAGIKGSMAGSNLGMALTKLQNPSSEAKDAMSELGFNAYDSAGKMKPLASQVDELKGKLAGMTDKQKQYYLAQIYGVQGGRAMNVLLQAQDGKLQGLTKSLVNSDGAAAKMAKTMQNDLSSSVEQFFGGLESLSIILEETFSGALKSGIDSVTDGIGKLTTYLQDNQEAIQNTTKKIGQATSGMLQFLPSLQQVGTAIKILLPSFLALETFKGIGVGGAATIKALQTIQADLSLVQRGLIMTRAAAKTMGTFTLGAFTKFGSAAKGATVKLNNFNRALMSANAPTIFKGKITGIGSALRGIPGKSKSAGAALIAAFTNPRAAVTGLNTKFYGLLQTLGVSDSAIAALTNTTMKSGSAIGKIGQAGKGATESMLSGATAAGGFGMSLGALLPIAAGIATVAAAIYVAWSSNFMNIQGVVKTAIGGIKDSFASTKPAINAMGEALKPIGTLLVGILKVVGATALIAIVGAVNALALALRLVVNTLTAIAKVGTSAGNVLKAVGLAATGHFKAAGKAIDASKKDMKQAGSAVKDMGQAYLDTAKTGIDAFRQIGKSTDKSKGKLKSASVSVKAVGSAAKQMKSDFDESKTKLSDLINTDGVSDKTKEFLTNVNETLDEYQSNAKTAAAKYKKSMASAEKESGQARLNAINQANAKLANATQKNSKNLINITQDLDRQLRAKKFSDGTAMNADQINLLTDQNNKIKQKLIEQNQIFVQAQLSRLQNGKKLNQTQQEATVTTLQSNYQLEAQQIQVGEDKIKQLKQQIDQAKDQTTKAQLQQQLVDQQEHNNQLVQKQQTFGQQMNMTIANGSKLNYTTWAQGLQNMKNVTTPQLQSMFLSFVQMNNNTSQQMQAFALMLQHSGIKGVNGLVTALQDGKLTTKEATAAMKAGGEAGLAQLPNSMFKKGNSGKNSFIKALKNGDFKGAGKYLATQSATGADQKRKHSKSGKNNNKSYADGVKDGKEQAKRAGIKIAKSGVDGSKSKKSSYKSSGKSNGKSYNSGVKSKKDSARSAGKSLAKAAKNGAKGVSFNSVGAQMAKGVAAGIRNNTGAAVSAMASLVAQVNREAKKKAKIKSPSRLLRDEVGRYLSLGVAVGIADNTNEATDAMGGLINNVSKVTQAKPLNFNFDNNQLNPPVFTPNASSNPISQNVSQLLQRLIDKKQFIVLDTGALVGATTDQYNDSLGQNIQNTMRWGRS